jgi:hypothetical protein
VLIVPAPVGGVIAHATVGLLVFPTVAVNCCVCPAYSVALVGARPTVMGGDKVITADANLVGSA